MHKCMWIKSLHYFQRTFLIFSLNQNFPGGLSIYDILKPQSMHWWWWRSTRTFGGGRGASGHFTGIKVEFPELNWISWSAKVQEIPLFKFVGGSGGGGARKMACFGWRWAWLAKIQQRASALKLRNPLRNPHWLWECPASRKKKMATKTTSVWNKHCTDPTSN